MLPVLENKPPILPVLENKPAWFENNPFVTMHNTQSRKEDISKAFNSH